MSETVKKKKIQWGIGEVHRYFGQVVAVSFEARECIRHFRDINGFITRIPLSVLAGRSENFEFEAVLNAIEAGCAG